MPYPGLKSQIKQTLTFLKVSYKVVINDSLSMQHFGGNTNNRNELSEMNFQSLPGFQTPSECNNNQRVPNGSTRWSEGKFWICITHFLTASSNQLVKACHCHWNLLCSIHITDCVESFKSRFLQKRCLKSIQRDNITGHPMETKLMFTSYHVDIHTSPLSPLNTDVIGSCRKTVPM